MHKTRSVHSYTQTHARTTNMCMHTTHICTPMHEITQADVHKHVVCANIHTHGTCALAFNVTAHACTHTPTHMDTCAITGTHTQPYQSARRGHEWGPTVLLAPSGWRHVHTHGHAHAPIHTPPRKELLRTPTHMHAPARQALIARTLRTLSVREAAAAPRTLRGSCDRQRQED